jgi:hypothetical protein
VDRHGRRLRTALDAEGVLLQHDTRLPSATAAVVGEAVSGSWWAHPMCHDIYRALNDLEDEGLAIRCPLVGGKVTLVAPRLWPPLLAVATERAAWQTDRLTPPAERLLGAVDAAGGPVLLDARTRDAGKRLARALLVHAGQVHLDTGRHTTGLTSWAEIERTHGIVGVGDPAAGRAAFEAIVEGWSSARRLLPWPAA